MCLLDRTRLLRWLAVAMGCTCAAIGIYHVVLGITSVPGAGAGDTLAGMRWLAGFMFLGGIGRVVSLLQYGRPHWFQLPLAAIELALPPVYVWLAERPPRG